MLWEWHHAEYRTHPGWVPQVTVHRVDNGKARITTLDAEGDVSLDTRTAARTHNQQLIRAYLESEGWVFQPAANEDEW